MNISIFGFASFIGREVRGFTSSTCLKLRFPSILRPCSEDFCSHVTSMYLKLMVRKVRGRKNHICIQLCIPILVYASVFKVISLIKNLIMLPR